MGKYRPFSKSEVQNANKVVRKINSTATGSRLLTVSNFIQYRLFVRFLVVGERP